MIELPKRARPATNADINIVPYIDVMLVLLVIFMMTTPIIEQGIEENSIIIKEDILSGVNSALEWAESGDLLLLLALDQKEECIEAIQTFCAD